jgi:glycosyltransferase involved in cell wall biosynthesis
MNIWIFNHYAVTPDTPGGTRHYDLARELVKRGHQVTIIASSFHHGRHQEIRLAFGERWKIEDVDGVKFAWIKTFPYQRNDWHRVLSMVSYMLQAWRIGRRLPKLFPEVEKPNVIIGSSVHLLAVLAAYWVAKHYRARFIMEVRDLWPQTIIDMGEMSERNPIVKTLQFLERFLYRRAERIITLLPLAHEYITSCGVPSEKIVWIPNGVDLNEFKGVESRYSSNNSFKVIYLGAHGQANALDVLLQSAKIVQERGCQEIEFILIGDGPEKSRLIELARKLELRNVEFRDPVPKSEVTETLSEADAFVFNLESIKVFKYGISPNKLFDYMAAGKPVIFSVKASNNPVDEAQCGLTVSPRNPKALAEAIIKLSRMPKEERQAMGRRGREYVQKYHSMPVLAEKLIQCIEQVEKRG